MNTEVQKFHDTLKLVIKSKYSEQNIVISKDFFTGMSLEQLKQNLEIMFPGDSETLLDETNRMLREVSKIRR